MLQLGSANSEAWPSRVARKCQARNHGGQYQAGHSRQSRKAGRFHAADLRCFGTIVEGQTGLAHWPLTVAGRARKVRPTHSASKTQPALAKPRRSVNMSRLYPSPDCRLGIGEPPVVSTALRFGALLRRTERRLQKFNSEIDSVYQGENVETRFKIAGYAQAARGTCTLLRSERRV